MTARVAYRPSLSGIDLRPDAVLLGAGVATFAAAATMAAGPAAFAVPLLPAAAVLLVRWPFALLTLYVWIGLFKAEPIVQAFPVDVTLLLAVLLVGVCASRWAAGRVRPIPFGLAAPVAAIALMLVVSLAWTPSPAYGGDKAFKFVSLTLLAALAPFFLVEDEQDLRRFFWWTVAFAGFTAVVTVADPGGTGGRLGLGDAGDTIGTSHLLCTAALILLMAALTDLVRAHAWAVAASVLLVVVAAAVGSRGPLLSLAFALAATAAVWLARVPRKVLPALLVVLAGVAVLPFVSLPAGSSQRLGSAVSSPVATLEGDARYTTYGEALQLIEAHSLAGVGAGGFESTGLLSHPPERYPHNLFLEVWSELGLAALVVLAASIIAVVVALWQGAWRLPPGPACALLYMLTAFFLFNLFAAQLSGDLNENRAFWGAFGLAWLVARHGVPAPRGSAP